MTPELAAEMGSPSFVTIHPNGKFLYAVGEGGGKDGGPVVAFAIDAKTGNLTKLNENKSGGPGPCHISVHPKGTHAIVANYGGGSTAVFKLGEDGKIVERTAFVQHKGSSVNKGRQGEPHAHCGFFDQTGMRAMTVDLGLDKVKVFAFDPAKGTIEDDGADDITTPPGSGPRHIAVAPDGKFAYVCGELNSTVNVDRIRREARQGGAVALDAASADEGKLDRRVHSDARTASSCTSRTAGTTPSRCSR